MMNLRSALYTFQMIALGLSGNAFAKKDQADAEALKSKKLIISNLSAESFVLSDWEKSARQLLSNEKSDSSKILNLSRFEEKLFSKKTNKDSATMNQARFLFEKQKFDLALNQYNKIERGNDLWLEAVEEKSWTYFRQGQFEKSLAETKTLLSEPFLKIVGSEPFFLQSLTQLRICDYKGVLETQEKFKDSQRTRIEAIEKLSQTGSSIAFLKVIDKVNHFPLQFSEIGQQANELPRLFYKDIELQKQMFRLKTSTKALGLLNEKISSAKAEQKQQMEKVFRGLKAINETANKNLYSRMKLLAQIEDKQNQKMIQKLGLIEVETIQRLEADKNLDRKAFQKGNFKDVSNNDLVFPDDGHPWIDELDKYQVKTNSCPQNIRRKM